MHEGCITWKMFLHRSIIMYLGLNFIAVEKIGKYEAKRYFQEIRIDGDKIE